MVLHMLLADELTCSTGVAEGRKGPHKQKLGLASVAQHLERKEYMGFIQGAFLEVQERASKKKVIHKFQDKY